MKVLCGEYLLSIDDKARLLVPAEVRRFFDIDNNGPGLFAVIGRNRKPWIYHEKVYAEIVKSERSELAPDASQLAFDQMYYSMAAPVELDKQGRILVPDHIRRRTKLEREVTMVGVRDHLELWNRPEWDDRIEFLLSQSDQIVDGKKSSSPVASGSGHVSSL